VVNVMKRLKNLLPQDLQSYLPPIVYGMVGGGLAVLFQAVIRFLFTILYRTPSVTFSKPAFIWFSLAVILVSSTLAGLILTYISRDAAGSGIPQLKAAFWKDFGFMRPRIVFAKLIAGIVTIGGGASLGREGPSIHIAAAAASNVAAAFGIAKQGRRPALLCGAAAGLAAAFNTPISAITFVLEEVIEDLNSTQYLAQVLIASVTSTFVAHLFLGNHPAFVIPRTAGSFSWYLYLLVIPVAAASALVGAGFQKATIGWRDQIKKIPRIPLFLKPVIGTLINWGIGILAFLAIARISVFGLGYDDLEVMLHGSINAQQTCILLICKLVATIAVYAWGASGGIFSPTLFFGAATGFTLAKLFSAFFHFQTSDELALTIVGMSACLGAVVRAPITSILIVFEMTHQFDFVPLLMIGTIASQAVARALCKTNFYSEILERDGIDAFIPPRSLADLRKRPIAIIARFTPVYVTTTQRASLLPMLKQHPYRLFPLITDGKVQGIVDRKTVELATVENVEVLPSFSIYPHQTIQEAIAMMISNSTNLLTLISEVDGALVGVVTLHDILRLQGFQESSYSVESF
jgi:chloride channel protein, CIC family